MRSKPKVSKVICKRSKAANIGAAAMPSSFHLHCSFESCLSSSRDFFHMINYLTRLMAVVESLYYISKEDKDTIILWYWLSHSLSFVILAMVYGYASDEIYGIYGTLHGKREYPLHILGEFLQKVMCMEMLSQKISYSSYKVSDPFPFKWINKKWREGFHVTSMATAGSRWGVVMSRNSDYSEQVVELDFLYPSEGVHRRIQNYINSSNN